MSERGGFKVQGSVSRYHAYVIDKLVGIEGTSPSDVASRIIGNWIREHEDWLAKHGISIENWNEPQSRPREVVKHTPRQRRTFERPSDETAS